MISEAVFLFVMDCDEFTGIGCWLLFYGHVYSTQHCDCKTLRGLFCLKDVLGICICLSIKVGELPSFNTSLLDWSSGLYQTQFNDRLSVHFPPVWKDLLLVSLLQLIGTL